MRAGDQSGVNGRACDGDGRGSGAAPPAVFVVLVVVVVGRWGGGAVALSCEEDR